MFSPAPALFQTTLRIMLRDRIPPINLNHRSISPTRCGVMITSIRIIVRLVSRATSIKQAPRSVSFPPPRLPALHINIKRAACMTALGNRLPHFLMVHHAKRSPGVVDHCMSRLCGAGTSVPKPRPKDCRSRFMVYPGPDGALPNSRRNTTPLPDRPSADESAMGRDRHDIANASRKTGSQQGSR
jgi:hypothetical protein